MDLRLGRWQDVLADVTDVDAVITDPPYSARVHDRHNDGSDLAHKGGGHRKKSDGQTNRYQARRRIAYEMWGEDEVHEFAWSWVNRCRGWVVSLSDSVLCNTYRDAYERHGFTGFAPVVVLIPGMTVRLAGDGPSSWAIYANVGRPKVLSRWGTLPGGYYGNVAAERGSRVVGGKPLWLMRALIRDYTKPGDLIVDPCAGGGTTLLAAAIEGRRAIGAECDPDTYAKAKRRLEAGYTPDMFAGVAEAARGDRRGGGGG